MHRRRGLVTQAGQSNAGLHALDRKRDRSGSDSGLSDSSSVSSALSSGLSELEAEVKQREQEKQKAIEPEAKQDVIDDPGSPRSKLREERRKRNPKKEKQTLTDETRWQKMKLKGSDKELLVDMSRVQKYVDYDCAGVQTFQAEVQQTKGNFRQQLADYSDL